MIQNKQHRIEREREAFYGALKREQAQQQEIETLPESWDVGRLNREREMQNC